MTSDDLRAEITIEIEAIENILDELTALYADVGSRNPTVREKTAAAAFMAQFYGGIENILKRISRFYSVPLPAGETWHLDLFQRFCDPAYHPLPNLFDRSLASDLAPYRRFRHVVYHGYGFELEWERMKEGIEKAANVFARVKAGLSKYLENL